MKIGFGSTVLAQGLQKNHIDGIGVYSKYIYTEMSKIDIEILPFSFGSCPTKKLDFFSEDIYYTKQKYSFYTALHTLNIQYNKNLDFQKKIDIFFAPDHHIPLLKNVPVVSTVMDVIPFIHPEWVSAKLRKAKNFAFKKMVNTSDHIITISEYSKKDIIQHMGIAESKISVVPLGVSDEYFIKIPLEKKLKVLKKYNIEKKFFVYIGTLQPRKNVLNIIHAFENMSRDFKSVYELIIIGKNGWDTESLMEGIQKMEISKMGKWLNYVPQCDILAIMQSAQSMIYPSLYEGFGLPILEAFASDCPVITSNVTSIPEVTGSAAYLINPYSINDISNSFIALSNENIRNNLINLGRERVKMYNWTKSNSEHLKIFEKVLDNY